MRTQAPARTNRQANPIKDWHELRIGETVHITKNAQFITSGAVDEVSDSGRVLWITNNQQKSQMFSMSEGVIVLKGNDA